MNSRSLLLLVALVAPSVARAAIVDRVQLAEPRSALVDAGPGRVVASDSGRAFLVHGQRISIEGHQIDAQPIPGADGYPVGWHDGWLLVKPEHDQLLVKHLGESGPPTTNYSIPVLGEFLGASSAEGRLAILERVFDAFPSSLWLTIADERGIVSRRRLAILTGGIITRFQGGFLLITEIGNTLQAWILAADGNARNFRQIVDCCFTQVTVAGNRALLLTGSSGRILDASLALSELITIPVPPLAELDSVFALPFDDRFLISYALRRGNAKETRALIVSGEGAILEDGLADPIVAGDFTATRYLVLRPWGHAGLATDDPRRIVAAFPLKRHDYERLTTLKTAVSGDVTLVVATGDPKWTPFFTRVDDAGVRIDPEPRPLANEIVVPIPDGFAFLSRDLTGIRMRRLARRGGWIDGDSILVTEPAIERFAARSNGRDLLLAWTTRDEIVWSRYTFEGFPMDAARRMPRNRPGAPIEIDITARDDERLIILQETFTCHLGPCLIPQLQLHALALDADGRPLGPWTSIDSYGSMARAIARPDGTWIVPLTDGKGSVLHLERDGSLLRIAEVPALEGGIIDFDSTAMGWNAIVYRPLRVVEMIGVDSVRSMTGLSNVTAPRFAGDWVAFLGTASADENVLVPWLGRLAAAEGDLSIRLSRLPYQVAQLTEVRVTIQNEGSTTASNVWIANEYGILKRISSMAPGEVQHLNVAVNANDRLYVYSDDIADVDPSDNAALVSSASPPARRRSAGR